MTDMLHIATNDAPPFGAPPREAHQRAVCRDCYYLRPVAEDVGACEVFGQFRHCDTPRSCERYTTGDMLCGL